MRKATGWSSKAVDTEILAMPSSTPENEVTVKVKKRKLAPLARMRMIPSDLLKKVMAGKQEEMSDADNAELGMMTLKVEEYVLRSVVSPKIISRGEPKEGEYLLEDVPQEDLEFLMRYFLGTGEAEELEGFRHGRTRSDPGSDVQKIQLETVNSNGAG